MGPLPGHRRWAGRPGGHPGRAHGADAERFSRDTRWGLRWSWKRDAKAWAALEGDATDRFERLAGPERQRLADEKDRLEQRCEELGAAKVERQEWLGDQPEATLRLNRIDRELAGLEPELAVKSYGPELAEHGLWAPLRATGQPLREPGIDLGMDLGP